MTSYNRCSTLYYCGQFFLLGGNMSFSIRLNTNEKALAESYAKLHSLSLAEAFKQALFEKIEDEYDIALAEIAYKEYKENPKTYSHNEVIEMLGL